MRAQVDAICLRYFCLTCGAAPGMWCVTAHDDTAPFLHASRFQQAVEDGELPLPDD